MGGGGEGKGTSAGDKVLMGGGLVREDRHYEGDPNFDRN